MTIPLVTLEQYQTYANTTRNEAELLVSTSRLIEQETGRHFLPYYSTKTFVVARPCSLLWLHDDLLEVTSVTMAPSADALVSTTITEYRLWNALREAQPPYNVIEYKNRQFYGEVTITGLWGYSNEWQTVDTLAADVTDTDVTLMFSTPAGLDYLGLTGMQTLALYRLESEFVFTLAADTASGAATVRRAVNGSTAAPHLTGVAIERFMVDAGIVNVTLAWAKWLKHEGQQHTRASSVQRGGPTPGFTHSDLYQRLQQYDRRGI